MVRMAYGGFLLMGISFLLDRIYRMDRIPGREKSNSDGSEGSANATLACPSLSPQLSIMANSPQLETRLFRLLSLSDMTDKFYRIAESVSRDRRKTPPDDGPP